MRRMIALLAALISTTAAAEPAYRITGSIAGPDGSWDYASVDPATDRLYVARGDAVTVVDLASGTVASVGEARRGHAVVPLPDGRLLVTSGADASVRFLGSNGRQLAQISVGKKPDAAILDATGKHAFVMNSDSGSISVIDTAAMRVERMIAVKPALEYAALVSDTLFVNNEDLNEIETIDVAHGSMGAPIAMPGCEGPTGLGYDRKHNRLISACDNGKAAVIDVEGRRLVALIDIGAGPDAVIVDAERDLAFIPAGKDGVLDILSLASPDAVSHVGRIATEKGARTGALDPATGAIYLPTAKFDPPGEPGARPTPTAGTFHILIVTPASTSG